ncbi:MAG: hypothetical protein R3C20_22405 [Planctomycetaceae bacterium]
MHLKIVLVGRPLLVFRNGQRESSSFDDLFGGGDVRIQLRDAVETVHVIRYARLKALATTISDVPGLS